MRIPPRRRDDPGVDSELPLSGASPIGLGAWIIEARVPTLASSAVRRRDAYIHGVHDVLQAAARRLATPAREVRFVRSIFLPGQQRCICVFEAAEAATVQLVSDTAQLSFVQISAAVELPVQLPVDPPERVDR